MNLAWKLFDPYQPWVLVPEGSWNGYFDWVPRKFRVGPISYVAIAYYAAVVALTAESIRRYNTYNNTAYYYDDNDPNPSSLLLLYPSLGSWGWYYHVLASIWMGYVAYLVATGSSLGWFAWTTYTVQSWTWSWIRHVLCALLGIVSATTSTTTTETTTTTHVFLQRRLRHLLLGLVEDLRFPCAVTTTVTFVIWNLVLVPFVLMGIFRHDAQKRHQFRKFCTSFRLIQLHFFNLPLCVMNVVVYSPSRKLNERDWLVALILLCLYMTFYFGILDRCGVHLYPVFTPRIGTWVAISWTGILALYLANFYAWQYWLQQQPRTSMVNSSIFINLSIEKEHSVTSV
jgi:hypothetical protein